MENKEIEKYKAGFISFFILIVYFVLLIIYISVIKVPFLPMHIMISIGIVFSVTTFLSICIQKNVFTKVKNPSNGLLFVYLILTLFLIVNTVIKFKDEEPEKIYIAIYYLMFAIMFLAILVSIIIKKNLDKKK